MEQLRTAMTGEFVVPKTKVIEVAQLSFGRGQVGKRHPLTNEQQKRQFADELQQGTRRITIPNTADCGDERLTLRLAANDPNLLLDRTVSQVFGGIGLATTKALVAANAVAIRGAKNIWDALLITDDFLKKLGYENAGHADCGASKAVESSVANSVPLDLLVPAVSLLVRDDGGNSQALERINTHKKSRLESGFYGYWDTANYEQFLIDRYPHNFSCLQVDEQDHETHGHNGSGLYVITEEGEGFQKNGRAFAVTLPIMKDIADSTGGSEEERRDILLAFIDDTCAVGAGIVAEDFPVFAQAA